MMKNGILLLFSAITICLLAFCLDCSAQDTIKHISKFESFASREGTMKKMVTKTIDKIKDVTIYLYTCRDIETGDSSRAIYLIQVQKGYFSGNNIGGIYIDLEDLAGFIKALKYVNSLYDEKKPEEETSFVYSTPSKNANIVAMYSSSGFNKGWTVVFNNYISSLLIKEKQIEPIIASLEKIGI